MKAARAWVVDNGEATAQIEFRGNPQQGHKNHVEIEAASHAARDP